MIALRLAAWLTGVMAMSNLAGQTTGSGPRGSLPLDPVTQRWTGDFDGMVQRRCVRLLTPYNKTHYFIDRGVARGLAFEFGVKLEQEINRRLKRTPASRIHVVFVPAPRERLEEWLIEGRGDIIASNVVVTPERMRRVDFTVPGQTGVRQIIVSGPGAPPLRHPDDLSGLEIAVRDRSEELESVQRLNREFAVGGRRLATVRLLPPALEDGDLLEMVNAGLLQATVVNEVIGRFWARVLPDITLRPALALRHDMAIAWAVRRDSPLLLSIVNPIVAANRIGTPFGNATLYAYLGNARFVTRATSRAGLARFHGLRTTFQRHATKYDLDPLLLMAQAFQESGLNQDVRSRSGAVGVMQIMPRTGREMKVGDIHQLGANVEAGAKYLRLLIDRYFAEEPADALNRMLFAFAAYNCGPARVHQLRRETAARGLDANLWFDNVERVTGEVVGRQTVDYVSSIYKYYVAYKLAEGAAP